MGKLMSSEAEKKRYHLLKAMRIKWRNDPDRIIIAPTVTPEGYSHKSKTFKKNKRKGY